MSYVVLQNPDLDGARCTIHVDALPEFEARGWVPVGAGSGPLSTVTLDEQAAADANAAARAAEQLAALQTPDPESVDTPDTEPDNAPADPAAADAATASNEKE